MSAGSNSSVEGALRRRMAAASLGELTRREREVLQLMADGYANDAICEHLVLSHKTVESHIRTIFIKLGLSGAAGISPRVVAVVVYMASAHDDSVQAAA
jgi:DNA-binding NarL/FixJ family response regulator